MPYTGVSGIGRFGFGVAGGEGHEFQLFGNRIVQGMFAGAPTTASTQATGTGAYAYRADIDKGILVCSDVAVEYAVQADYAIDSGATANLVSGESIVYSIIAFRSRADGNVRIMSIPGAAAITDSQVAPTAAEIETFLELDTFYYKICDVTINRTGDTTVTQAQNNLVRPLLVPIKG